MSDLPPPTGTPVAFALYGDPWAEQARRHAAHRAERRARRRRWLISLGVPAVVLSLGGAAVAMVLFTDDDARESAVAVTTVSPNASIATPPGEATTDASIPADDAASVDEVWLLDRGNGSYDWGAIVSSASDVARRDLAVTVTFFDADGAEVYVDDVVIVQLVPNGRAAVGGVVEIDRSMPTRIDVTATLGSAAPDTTGTAVAAVDVRRVSSGQIDRDDRLLGSLEVSEGDPRAVRVAAMWRDDAGNVIASIFDMIEIADAGVLTDFSLRLPRLIVPAGEPDEVIANAAVLG